jgi:hypothetical protein
MTLRLTCRLCGMVIGLAGDRITDAALQALRDHLVALHSDRAKREHGKGSTPARACGAGVLPATAGDVLAWFDVDRQA